MSRNEAQVRFELIDPALEADFRERMRSHFVATTKDVLTTGVNVLRSEGRLARRLALPKTKE